MVGNGSLKPNGARLLAGQHALITGAGQGIGAAIAGSLARLGADLTLLGRREKPLTVRSEALNEAYGANVHVAVADVTEEGAVQRAFAAATDAWGPRQCWSTTPAWPRAFPSPAWTRPTGRT
jgi:NAD(P)-dependent dehydrogenase (short-subunit alcohol dehydrogenase family)